MFASGHVWVLDKSQKGQLLKKLGIQQKVNLLTILHINKKLEEYWQGLYHKRIKTIYTPAGQKGGLIFAIKVKTDILKDLNIFFNQLRFWNYIYLPFLYLY